MAELHNIADARRRREHQVWDRQRERQIEEGRERLRRLLGTEPEPPGAA